MRTGLGVHTEQRVAFINQTVIDAIIEAIVDNDGNFIRALDINNDIIELLQTVPATDIRKMIKRFGAQLIDVKLNQQALAMFNAYVVNESDNEQVTNRAILAGARFAIISDMTGMGRYEYEERRKLLDARIPSRGRVERLDEATEHKVIQSWLSHSHEPKQLMRACIVADETGANFNQVWDAVQDVRAKASVA